MASRLPFWVAAAVGLSLLLVFYIPSYSINGSLAATFVVSYILLRVATAIYWVILYPAFFTPFKHIPVAPGRSIWNGHYSSLAGQPSGGPSAKWAETVPNNGFIRFYLLLNMERILPTSPKTLSEILTHKSYDFHKPESAGFLLSVIIGNGILLAEGDLHKAQRRNLNPAFSYRHVKDLYPVFWKKGTDMVKAMEGSIAGLPADKKVINIADWASRVTLDIVGLAGMGQDFNALLDPNNMLYKHYQTMFSEPPRGFTIPRLLSVLLSDQLYFKLIPETRNRDLLESSAHIRDFSRKIIHEKKEKMAKNEDKDMDIISVALESGFFTEDALVDQVMTFLAAGHETTSTALQWAVYALCTHQDIQKNLREEVRSSLPTGSDGATGPIGASQIDSMPYLNAFCNEVLRYYPPVRITVRQAAKDTQIADTFMPKGTNVVIVPQAFNQNPELWGPDAKEFNPDRWMGSGKAHTGGAQSNYALLTFLQGPRNCIGAAFARGELASLVAAIVSRFDMELEDPNMELNQTKGVTAKPKGGVRVRMKVVD